MLQFLLVSAVHENLISNDGYLRILLLSEIKMFHAVFTDCFLSMSDKVPITTNNSFLLLHRAAMGASIRCQYFIMIFFNLLTVILYENPPIPPLQRGARGDFHASLWQQAMGVSIRLPSAISRTPYD